MRIFNLLILSLIICNSCNKPNNDPQPEVQQTMRISKVVTLTPYDTITFTPYYNTSDLIDSIVRRQNLYPTKMLTKFSYENRQLTSRSFIREDFTAQIENFEYNNQQQISKYQALLFSPGYNIPPRDYYLYYHPNGEISHIKDFNNDSIQIYNISPQSKKIKSYSTPNLYLNQCIPEISLSINSDNTINYTDNNNSINCTPVTKKGNLSSLKNNIPTELWNTIGMSIFESSYAFPNTISAIIFKDIYDNEILLEWQGYNYQLKVDQYGRILDINLINKYTGTIDRKTSFYY